jgi:hypothetical protein
MATRAPNAHRVVLVSSMLGWMNDSIAFLRSMPPGDTSGTCSKGKTWLASSSFILETVINLLDSLPSSSVFPDHQWLQVFDRYPIRIGASIVDIVIRQSAHVVSADP